MVGIFAVPEQVISQDIPLVVERMQEQIVDTIDVTPQGSQFGPNTSSTSTSQHDFISSSSTSTVSDVIAIMLNSLTNIDKEVERAAMLTKRMMENSIAAASHARASSARTSHDGA